MASTAPVAEPAIGTQQFPSTDWEIVSADNVFAPIPTLQSDTILPAPDLVAAEEAYIETLWAERLSEDASQDLSGVTLPHTATYAQIPDVAPDRSRDEPPLLQPADDSAPLELQIAPTEDDAEAITDSSAAMLEQQAPPRHSSDASLTFASELTPTESAEIAAPPNESVETAPPPSDERAAIEQALRERRHLSRRIQEIPSPQVAANTPAQFTHTPMPPASNATPESSPQTTALSEAFKQQRRPGQSAPDTAPPTEGQQRAPKMTPLEAIELLKQRVRNERAIQQVTQAEAAAKPRERKKWSDHVDAVAADLEKKDLTPLEALDVFKQLAAARRQAVASQLGGAAQTTHARQVSVATPTQRPAESASPRAAVDSRVAPPQLSAAPAPAAPTRPTPASPSATPAIVSPRPASDAPEERRPLSPLDASEIFKQRAREARTQDRSGGANNISTPEASGTLPDKPEAVAPFAPPANADPGAERLPYGTPRGFVESPTTSFASAPSDPSVANTSDAGVGRRFVAAVPLQQESRVKDQETEASNPHNAIETQQAETNSPDLSGGALRDSSHAKGEPGAPDLTGLGNDAAQILPTDAVAQPSVSEGTAPATHAEIPIAGDSRVDAHDAMMPEKALPHISAAQTVHWSERPIEALFAHHAKALTRAQATPIRASADRATSPAHQPDVHETTRQQGPEIRGQGSGIIERHDAISPYQTGSSLLPTDPRHASTNSKPASSARAFADDTTTEPSVPSHAFADQPESLPFVPARPVSPQIAGYVRESTPTPLPESTQRFLRPVVGFAVDSARVHRGAVADQVASAYAADAVTIGDDVLLAAGHAEDTPETLGLLAHELTHVARQREGLQGSGVRGQGLERLGAPFNSGVQSDGEEALARQVEAQVVRIAQAQDAQRHSASVGGAANVGRAEASAQVNSSADHALQDWNGLPAPWEPLPSWLTAPAPPSSAAVAPPIASVVNRPTYASSFATHSAPVAAPVAQLAETTRPAPAPAPESTQPEQANEEAAGPDLDALAKQVYDVLKRRLAAERRRLG
jgi:hypothetical protein